VRPAQALPARSLGAAPGLTLDQALSVRGLKAEEVAASLLAAAARAAACDRALFLVRDGAGAPLKAVAALGFAKDAWGGDADPKDRAPLERVVQEALRLEHPIRMDVEARGLGRRSAVAIPVTAVLREGRKPGYADAPMPGERRKAGAERLLLPMGAVYLDRPLARPLETTDLDRAEAVVEAAAKAYALARRHEAVAFDGETGCVSRGELRSALETEIALARAAEDPLGVLLFGLDRRDELERASGRRAVQESAALLAGRLRRALRTSDLAVRHEGGALMALLPGADAGAATAAALRLLGKARQGAPGEPALAVSCGISIFPDHGARPDELLRRADQALVKAEADGGARAALWSAAIPRHALGTERLPGVVSGDPARDRRNVLLLLDAIAAVNSIKDKGHVLATVLDMLVEVTDAERGAVFTSAPAPSEAPAPEPASSSAPSTRSSGRILVPSKEALAKEAAREAVKEAAREALAKEFPSKESLAKEAAAKEPRLTLALAQDARRGAASPEGIPLEVVQAAARTHLPVASAPGAPADDAALEAAIRRAGLSLVIAVPLMAGERLVGVLYVDRKAPAPDALSHAVREPDLVFLQALSREVAVALENARLHEESERARREVEALAKKLAKQVKTQAHELEEAKAVIEGEIKTKYDYAKIVGKSPRMLEVFRLLDRITDTEVPVLIQGESGTGKELVAKAVHYNGPRSRKRFVSVNCAAIAPSLLESELFGHVKGAFTGADRDKPGLFEQADQGTIFLDEVQDMPAQLQRELLRVLQEKELRRVGGKDVLPVNVRVIAAANRDLRTLMRTGVFREDLYYRMAVVTIDLPPLRERKEDIPLIVDRHLKDLAKAQGRAAVSLDKSALRVLLRHEWPGNVRELHNVLERTVLMLDGDVITESTVALEVREAPRPASGGFSALPGASVAGSGAPGSSSASGRLPALRPGDSGRAGSGGFAAAGGAQGPSHASGRLPAVKPGSGAHGSIGTPPGSQSASGRHPVVRPGSGGHAALGGVGGATNAPGEGYDPALDPDLLGPDGLPLDEASALAAAEAYAQMQAMPVDAAGNPLPSEIFGLTYKDAAEAFKAEYIRRILATHQGNVTRASEQSGLFRSSFHKIMRKLDVSARDHRSGSGSGERRGAEGG